MPLTIDPKRWREGFQDAYAGRPSAPLASDNHSYASGRIEGEALRIEHRRQFERALFAGVQVRPIPKGST